MEHKYNPDAFLLDIECECCRKKMVNDCIPIDYINHPRVTEIIKEISLHSIKQTRLLCMELNVNGPSKVLTNLIYTTMKDGDMDFFRILFEECGQIARKKEEFLEFAYGYQKKNTDYGDAFAEYGTIGVLVRMGDKIKRLQSIEKNKITLVSDERLRDTLIDLHNYSAMAMLLLDKQ